MSSTGQQADGMVDLSELLLLRFPKLKPYSQGTARSGLWASVSFLAAWLLPLLCHPLL